MLQVKEPLFVSIDENDRKIAYDEVSPPDPLGTVLLLNGLAAKRLGWYHQLDFFGQEYRTIALDHRNISDSDPTAGPYSIGDLADDAAAVLRALKVERAHVIGISLGGFVSMELALRHPELVDKLVLVATSAGGPNHVPPGQEIMNLLTDRGGLEVGEAARRSYTRITAPGFAQNYPETIERIVQIARYRPLSLEAYYGQLQAGLTHNATERLEQIKAHTLVVHGDPDPLVPTENGHYLAEHIPGARLIIYPETGHVPIIERPDQFNRDVLAFLKS